MIDRFKMRRTSNFLNRLLIAASFLFISSNGVSQNIPPFKSDFDSFVTKLGGEIPFPPQEILKRLKFGEAFGPGTDVFPAGRSLERSVTDYEYPRSLVSWHPGGGWGEQVFFAYTPLKNQLEIISYNRNTNQNEFRILEDYKLGGNPKIVKPPVGACTACHQGGNLIFPKKPWSESFAGTKDFNGNINTLNHSSEYFRLIKDPFARFILFSGDGKVTPRIQPEFYERDVLSANSIKESRQACNQLCGDDLRCRKKMLTTYVISKGRKSFAEFSKLTGSTWETLLATNGHPLILKEVDSNLLDRNPLDKNNQDILLKEGSDPLMPRKVKVTNQSTILGLYQTCRNFGDVDSADRLSYAELLKLLDSPEIANLIVNDWFPSGDAIEAALKSAEKSQALGLPVHSESLEAMARKFKSKPTTEANLIEENRSTLAPAQAVIRYCASCHFGPSSLAPALPLLDPVALHDYTGTAGRKVESLLKKKIMPPVDEAQPTDEERGLILKWLNGMN